MKRRLFLTAAVGLALHSWCNVTLAARGQIVSETTAQQHGLTRPWFSQVALDHGAGRLTDLTLFEGVLYAQTDKAVVHALDAETGRTLWSQRVGTPGHVSTAIGLNRDLLAALNGSRLYVLNRLTGEVLLEKNIDGAPGAGPALSAKHVYIPMTTGMILAYRLDPPEKPKGEAGIEPALTDDETTKPETGPEKPRLRRQLPPPLSCQSYGKVLVQPLVTREAVSEEFVAWPTDRGFMNVARVDRHAEDGMALRYRLETGAAIVGRLAYLPPDAKLLGDSGLIIGASRDGFVYVFREKDGEMLWRFSVGEPIVVSPAVIEDRVYVTVQLGRMHCLAVKTGKELWVAPGVVQFVAASKSRVYATDRIGRLLVLDANSGARLDAIATETLPIKMLNTVTDRIYLGDDGGLIQCLREVERQQPLIYAKDRTATETEAESAAKPHAAAEKHQPAKKAAKKKPADDQ